MRKYLFVVFAAACVAPLLLSGLSSCAASHSNETDNPLIFSYQGSDREYCLYLPELSIKEKPLVILLHGYTCRAQDECPEFVREALKRGYTVCAPQGARDKSGNYCWNVGYPFQEGLETDDKGFLCALAREITGKYNLNPDNIFVTGMSNGGEMCYLLAYTVPDFFAAFAPISGLTMKWFTDSLQIGKPVSLMEVHGTADTVSEWNGDPDNRGGWGAYLAVPDAVKIWADAAGLLSERVSRFNDRVILHEFLSQEVSADSNVREVRLYEVRDGEHSWSLDAMDTVSEVLDFFTRHLTCNEKKRGRP